MQSAGIIPAPRYYTFQQYLSLILTHTLTDGCEVKEVHGFLKNVCKITGYNYTSARELDPENYNSRLYINMQMPLTFKCLNSETRYSVMATMNKGVRLVARAPDLHLNIHQLLKSFNNSTQHTTKVPHLATNFQPGHFNIDTWNVTVPDSLDSLSTTEKR